MKKTLSRTKCIVRLKKSETLESWRLYLDCYPVFRDGKTVKVIESLNRSITTPIWDKSKKSEKNGVVTYQPKRDINGVIMCRSQLDRKSCEYADNIRAMRQLEYDKAELLTAQENALIMQEERKQEDFIKYFNSIIVKVHPDSSEAIIDNWRRVGVLLSIYSKGKPIPFSKIDVNFLEDVKLFLLAAPQGGSKKGTISRNTASTYFGIVKSGLKRAFVDGYLSVDVSAKVSGISAVSARRETLTMEEFNKLAVTPCSNPIIKQAAFFSMLTGMRHSDIKKLKWKNIVNDDGTWRVDFTQQKTGGVEYMPISDLAYSICGKRSEPERCVFGGLPDPSWISRPILEWVQSAGITKHITFHCFRHTFATLQLKSGTDIYTVSRMLGHTKVTTTQIYAKVVDTTKVESANAIKVDDSIAAHLQNISMAD